MNSQGTFFLFSFYVGEFVPELMESFQEKVKKYLMSQLQEQMKSTVSKLDISIIDGCFKGLYHLLKHFPIKMYDKDGYWEKLYDALLKNSEYPEEFEGHKSTGRRYYRRSALNLFQRHAHQWNIKLIQANDCKIWFGNLKKWTESVNSEVRIFEPFSTAQSRFRNPIFCFLKSNLKIFS